MKYRVSDLPLFEDVSDLDTMFNVCNILFFSGEIAKPKLAYSTALRRAAGLCISTSPVYILISKALIYETTQYELVNTLAHEMCHALVFQRGEDDGQRDGHGPIWSALAYRLNKYFGLRITRYHYEIPAAQLEQMRHEGAERRRLMFLGRGRKLAKVVDSIDLDSGNADSVDLDSDVVVVDLDFAEVVDLS